MGDTSEVILGELLAFGGVAIIIALILIGKLKDSKPKPNSIMRDIAESLYSQLGYEGAMERIDFFKNEGDLPDGQAAVLTQLVNQINLEQTESED